MKQIKNWNFVVCPTSFDINQKDSTDMFQKYLDLSAILKACVETINIDLDQSKLIHFVFRDNISPFLYRQFYTNACINYSRDLNINDTQEQFVLAIAELIKEDTLIQVEVEYSDGSFELRTFEDLIPDIELSCTYKGQDLDIINLRAVEQNLSIVPFIDSSFLAIRYENLYLEQSKSRIPTGYLGANSEIPVTCFAYIENFSNWLETI